MKKTAFINIVNIYEYGIYFCDGENDYVRIAQMLMKSRYHVDKGLFPHKFTEPFHLVIAELKGCKFQLDNGVNFELSASMQVLVRQNQLEAEKKGVMLPYRNKVNCVKKVEKRLKEKANKLARECMKHAFVREYANNVLTNFLVSKDIQDALIWGMFAVKMMIAFIG